jgi:hypothetical protein
VEGFSLERTDWIAVRMFRVFFFLELKSESPSNAGA